MAGSDPILALMAPQRGGDILGILKTLRNGPRVSLEIFGDTRNTCLKRVFQFPVLGRFVVA
jgi:hypothetical protein